MPREIILFTDLRIFGSIIINKYIISKKMVHRPPYPNNAALCMVFPSFWILTPEFWLLTQKHYSISKWKTAHHWLNIRFQTLFQPAFRFRQPCGTQNELLSAASVRTWHGSKSSVAQDQNLIKVSWRLLYKRCPSVGIPPRYSGLRVQGTATSPSSAVKTIIAK